MIAKRKAWLIIFALFCVGLCGGAATQVDLTANVRGILPHGNGGTDSGFFSVAGPTALRTYTFPDATATVLTSGSAVSVPQGGTGVATLAAHGVLLGEGSGNVVPTSVGATGTCFMGNTGADPSFQSCPGGLNFADNEVPSGTPNGVLTTFTLAHTPNPAGSLTCFENGLEQRAAGADFTLATATLTYVVAPATNTTLACNYRY